MALDQKLTGPETRKLCEAVGQAFSPSELEQLTLFATNTPLENIVVQQQPFNQQVFQLIGWLDRRGRLRKFFEAALVENPGNRQLARASGEVLHAQARAEDLEALVNRNPDAFSNPEDWRDEMQRCEQAICRIESPQGRAIGTGFLVAPDLALTCHHVWTDIKDAGPVEQMRFAFGYRILLKEKKEAVAVNYTLEGTEPVAFSPTAELDFALLRVQGRPGEAKLGSYEQARARSWLQPKSYAFKGDETGLILQHPDGMPMKLAFGAIGKALENRVAYRIDTLGGSSGAPVFLNDWKPVALHRQGKETENRGVPFSLILPIIAGKLA